MTRAGAADERDGAEAGFTGEQQDGAGLVYLRARWYNTGTGRFLSKDPVRGWRGSPRSQHAYQYGYNNPGRYTDRSGQLADVQDVGPNTDHEAPCCGEVVFYAQSGFWATDDEALAIALGSNAQDTDDDTVDGAHGAGTVNIPDCGVARLTTIAAGTEDDPRVRFRVQLFATGKVFSVTAQIWWWNVETGARDFLPINRSNPWRSWNFDYTTTAAPYTGHGTIQAQIQGKARQLQTWTVVGDCQIWPISAPTLFR